MMFLKLTPTRLIITAVLLLIAYGGYIQSAPKEMQISQHYRWRFSLKQFRTYENSESSCLHHLP